MVEFIKTQSRMVVPGWLGGGRMRSSSVFMGTDFRCVEVDSGDSCPAV